MVRRGTAGEKWSTVDGSARPFWPPRTPVITATREARQGRNTWTAPSISRTPMCGSGAGAVGS